MTSFKVQVRDGRLVLDAPTDLPEGTEVEFVVLDSTPVALAADDIAELERRAEAMDRGEYVAYASVDDLMGDLRVRRATDPTGRAR